MISLAAVLICEAVVLLAAILWYIVSILLGALDTLPLGPLYLILASGLITSCLLAFRQRQRKTLRPQWLLIWAIVAMLPAALLIATGGEYQSWLIYVYLYLAMLFALSATRSILFKLSLQRSEELPVLLLRFLRVLGLTLFTGIIILPFYFMFFSSITPRAIFLQNPINLAPRVELGIVKLFTGYAEVMTTYRFGRYILNSLLVSISTVFLTLIPSVLGAYAVTRLRFRGRKFLSRSILLIYMFPSIVLAIPLYSVFASLGLRDTLLGLLIVYPAVTIPVSLYMLRNYFQTLPKDIEEAGIIDGCTRLGVIWRITLPLSLPALMAVGLYIFMIAWNEFLFAFMFLDKQSIFTLSRGVVSLNSQEVPRQFLMAGAIIITVPVMFIFFAFERFFTGGLSAGGVKG